MEIEIEEKDIYLISSIEKLRNNCIHLLANGSKLCRTQFDLWKKKKKQERCLQSEEFGNRLTASSGLFFKYPSLACRLRSFNSRSSNSIDSPMDSIFNTTELFNSCA